MLEHKKYELWTKIIVIKRKETVNKFFLVNDCLYVHVDVDEIIQFEPTEQVVELHVSVAELNVNYWK